MNEDRYKQAISSIQDVLTFRQTNARHISETSVNPEVKALYKGMANAFHETALLTQRECNNANVRPQAQASLQLSPGRCIVRVGSRYVDIRDSAVALALVAELADQYIRCEESEAYCMACDLAAVKIIHKYREI